MPKYLILVNPKAGGLKRSAGSRSGESHREYLAALLKEARAAGLEAAAESVPEASALKARLEAARKEGYDTIVAAGGDGTVRPIAQALIGTAFRLGILPVGTDNNFAHSLGIPHELPGALRVLAEGKERKVDVGCIGEEVFTESAGVGLFAQFTADFGPDGVHLNSLPRDMKRLLPLIWNPPACRLQLILDGTAYSEEAAMVSVCNSSYMGAGLAIAPGADISDGLFDVVIVGALSRWELLRFAYAVRRGKGMELPFLSYFRAASVDISRIRRSHKALPVHADDHIAAHTPVHLEVKPAALRVIGA